LLGALLVGVQVAKGLAWAADKPLIGVDHLVGHLLAVFLRRGAGPTPEFPFVALLVSGGHSALYRCDGPHAAQIHELGATRDDAVGEAFDKVGKLLGLGYPGGPVIDRLARGARDRREAGGDRLPTPMAQRDSLEMSFSGIKSAIARRVQQAPPSNDAEVGELCAEFQRVVVDILVAKTIRAARREGVRSVVISGGVACNGELRERMAAACRERDLGCYVPPPKSCTDNAAMIAYAGAVKLASGAVAGLDLSPATRTELPRVTRKGRGKRAT
jgi:N6-L-threonylcarbamoyladenine synthase